MEVPAPPEGFDWDPTKYVRNFRKHGVRFDDAIHAFSDLNGLEYLFDWENGEPRHVWLGMVFGTVLYIVYTERDAGAVTRLISARRAERSEVDEYIAR